MLNPNPDKRITVDELIKECENIKKKSRIDAAVKDGKLHGKIFTDSGKNSKVNLIRIIMVKENSILIMEICITEK